MRNKPEIRINDAGKEYPDQLPASIRRIFENQPQKHPDDVDILAEMAWILENDEPKRPRGDSEADQKAWDEERLRRLHILLGNTHRHQEDPARRRRIAAEVDWVLETCAPKRPCGDSEADKEACVDEFLRRLTLLGGYTHRLHKR